MPQHWLGISYIEAQINNNFLVQIIANVIKNSFNILHSEEYFK